MHSLMTRFQRTSRRRLATAMLFVWLFALVAGMANACALGGRNADQGAWQAASHHHDAAAPLGHGECDEDEAAIASTAAGPQDHDAACQKFCDDERSSVNVVAKDLGSPGTLLPVLVPFTTLAWTTAEVRIAALPPSEVPPCVTGPPIPIRLLRLTL